MKKLRVGYLVVAEVKTKFQPGLQCNLKETSEPSPETLWNQLKRAILKTSEEVLGYNQKKNKDWFDENDSEIQDLLSKKRSPHQAHLAHSSCPEKRATFQRACSVVQRKLREIQNEWWDHQT